MSTGVDPELLSEFLTESGELIERLDADLVELESQPESKDLLDQIFRALHTIKGAASFLNLAELVEFAHAAEDALNVLRKGERDVDQAVIDAMLRSVDVLRGQFEELSEGTPLTAGPQDLIAALKEISEGAAAVAAAVEPVVGTAPESAPVEAATDGAGPYEATAEPLTLGPEKADLIPFMADDLVALAECLQQWGPKLAVEASREEASRSLADLSDGADATASFFGMPSLCSITSLLGRFDDMASVSDAHGQALAARVAAMRVLVLAIAEHLGKNQSLDWKLDTFVEHTMGLLSGEIDPESLSSDDVDAVLVCDGVLQGAAAPASAEDSSGEPDAEANPPVSDHPADAEPGGADTGPQAAQQRSSESGRQSAAAEQTIRVEVSRLEALLNLVGEMVLTKNQVLGHARTLRDHPLPHDLSEQMNSIAGELDRLTGELQMGVMRTRMQPLSKLFGRYPRIVRDLSRKTNKLVHLEITGGDTEVDKTVLELLGDPLVHMIRNSVDHGIEAPETRDAAGKSKEGTIRLSASHQGGHVRVTIADDGKGMSRDVISAKAVEKGITTPEQVAQLSDSEIFKFIFAAGFSTAAQVSDLSGRGVGMDVVRTNISKLGGQIHVRSTEGAGTTFEILIPLTVAIMPAMLVNIVDTEYAIPLTAIHEIVRPTPSTRESVAGNPTIRLRNEVLPLIDLRERLKRSSQAAQSEGFAVVVGVGEQKAGLVVDRLLGQQEIVIKPLDDRFAEDGPFSGATILENGAVSLILDVIEIVRGAESAKQFAG